MNNIEKAERGPFILIIKDEVSELVNHTNCVAHAEYDEEYNYSSEGAESWLSQEEADRFIFC